jgi:hypothetical protein
MNVYEAIREIDELYNRMRFCDSTSGRKYNGEKILAVMRSCPEVHQYWKYRPEYLCWTDRFVYAPERKKTETIVIDKIVHDTSFNMSAIPNKAGVYFIGQTSVNPYTHEEQYWLKIGLSSSLFERMKTYNTHSPSIFFVGCIVCDNMKEMEDKFQRKLSKHSIGRCERNKEWWAFEEETYKKMCELGFKYFDMF